ncbi:MAG: PAS domain-containing protein [Chloroflexales bacterium]|nr:PAS domain-containing protein [Chloroflexales bacterium]
MDLVTLQVLLIADSPDGRLTSRRLLARFGPDRYTVRDADLGEQALAACQDHAPDCVLLDCRPPDRDGLRVLAALRNVTDAPVVLLIDVDQEAVALAACQSGAQDYLVYDHLTPERLHLTIQRAVAAVRLARERDCALSLEDVTARKEAEDARHRSEAYLRAVMACTPDIVFTVDRQLHIQFINRVPAGLAVEEALGTSALDYVLPEHRPLVEHSAREVFATGQPSAYEIQARGAYGVMVWYATRLGRLTMPEGIEQVLMITQDITARKAADIALQQAYTRLQLLAEASAAFSEAGVDAPALLDHLVQRTAVALRASCFIRLRQDDEPWLSMAAAYDQDPAMRATVGAIVCQTPIHIDDPHPAAQVVRSGQPHLAPAIDLEALRATLAPELWPVLDQVRLHSELITPLRVEGQTIGCLVLLRHIAEPLAFTQDDLTLAQDLADRAGLALAKALLYHAVQEAREAAQQAHAWLDALVRSVPSGIGYLDRELRYILVNPALAALNGTTPADHVGRTLAEVIPGLAPQLEPVLRQVLATGVEAQDLELRDKAPSPDERSRTWLLSVFPVLGPLGEVAGVGVTVTDITQIKRTEAELCASEARYRAMFEQNAAIQLLIDSGSGTIVDANPAAMHFYGYPRETLLAMPMSAISQLAPEQAHTELDAALQQVQNHFHFPHRLASGEVRAVEVFSSPIEVAGRQLLYSIIHDETERQQAKLALLRSERILKLFVEHAPAAIAMFDRSMTYLAASRRYLSDYQLGEQTVVGRSYYEVFPDRSARWKEVHQRCLAGAVESAEEDLFPRADGRVDWVRWEIHPWYEGPGEIGGLILFSEVITARKLAEAELREREARFHQTLDLMLEGCQIIGFDARYLYLNDSVARHARRPKEALLGRTMPEVFPGIEQTVMFGWVQRCLRERIAHRMENRFVYDDGSSA